LHGDTAHHDSAIAVGEATTNRPAWPCSRAKARVSVACRPCRARR
jgi:hypothetical protein